MPIIVSTEYNGQILENGILECDFYGPGYFGFGGATRNPTTSKIRKNTTAKIIPHGPNGIGNKKINHTHQGHADGELPPDFAGSTFKSPYAALGPTGNFSLG
jgi:hypothetical protein